MILLLALTACGAPSDPILGEWVAAFYLSQGAAAEATDSGSAGDSGQPDDTGVPPDCEDDSGAESFRGWLDITAADPVAGTHLVLASPAEDEDAARPLADNGVVPSSGMTGPLRGGFEEGTIRVHMLPDLDSPVASEADAARWSEGHLVLESHGWSRSCQALDWTWVDRDGQVDPEQGGTVFLRRAEVR